MSKKDYYIIDKNVNKIIHGESTNFLDPNIYKQVISKLKGTTYNTYYPYEDSNKVIIYTKDIPNIKLYEIISYEKLSHRQILGSLFGLNIDSELFGDIIINDNHYYIMVIDKISDLIEKEYTMVGNNHIKLKEVPLSTIKDYKTKYQKIELIVSSLRIDNVISSLIGTSREAIKNKFNNDEIILNYNTCHKINYILKENDVFSIRKHGKYKYIGTLKQSKKGNLVIECHKYIDN